MKPSSIFIGGLGLSVMAGLVFFLLGLWRPGQTGLPEELGGSMKPLLAEAKKKTELTREAWGRIRGEAAQLSGLPGTEGQHRVFVSAQLVYLPGNSEPVQPLDRKMKTEDGIQVGWKMKYGLDPADPLVQGQDLDGDGFTSFEEFQAGTDPTKKEDSPAKESKLRARAGETTSMAVSFPEKSGGFYTVRFQIASRRKEFKGKPGDLFWVMAGPGNLEVFSDEAKAQQAQQKAKNAKEGGHLIPLQISGYQEKVEKVKDATAGGIEVEVDNSELSLKRNDELASQFRLSFSIPQRPKALSWDVTNFRFYSPVAGVGEIGPFRLGESFIYEQKKFALVGREGPKVQLRDLAGGPERVFWVPPEDTTAVPLDKP